MASSRGSGRGRGGTGPSRYQRSSTASMTQLLSDSCSSLLHRLTSRVRGPSASVESASSRAAGLSLSSLGLAPLGSPWSAAGAAAGGGASCDGNAGATSSGVAGLDRAKDRDRARDRDHRDPGRPRSPTFSTFGQTRSRLEKKYGQKKATSPPPSPSARRSTQRSRHSKPGAGATATTPTPMSTSTSTSSAAGSGPAASRRKEASPMLGVSKVRHNDHYSARTAASPDLGSTRSRLEDKYSAILAKYGREPRERDKDRDRERLTAERRPAAPAERRSPHPLPLSKSATTSIVLSEKAYPYVSAAAAAASGPAREKTPYRHGERRSRHRSGHRVQPAPRLCPVEFSADAIDPVPAPAHGFAPSRPMSPGEREALMLVAAHEKREREMQMLSDRERERDGESERDRPSSPGTSEREARRKEIQSLILKYTTAVNDRLMRREQRELNDHADAAAAVAAAPVGAGRKADSGTLTPTGGSGRPTATATHLTPATPAAAGVGPTLAHGLGLGLGPVPGYGLGLGPGPGPGHSLGKSASGVFPSAHSDSGAIYKSQQKYSALLNRRPNLTGSASSLALPNFKFVRRVHGALVATPALPVPPPAAVCRVPTRPRLTCNCV